MASQDDKRMDWIHHEYGGMRDAMFKLMKRMDGYEAAVLGMTEAVSQNGERLVRLEQRFDTLEQALLENRRILLMIAEHLGLVIERPPQNPQPD